MNRSLRRLSQATMSSLLSCVLLALFPIYITPFTPFSSKANDKRCYGNESCDCRFGTLNWTSDGIRMPDMTLTFC